VVAIISREGSASSSSSCPEVKFCLTEKECDATPSFNLPLIKLPVDISFLLNVDGIRYSLQGLINRIVLGWHDTKVILKAGEVQARDFEEVIIERCVDQLNII
jgi:hypothetical protein